MKLKKCPICDMPNEFEASECSECGHVFASDHGQLDRNEIIELFQKEKSKYKDKLKDKLKYEKQREFFSLKNLMGYYIVNFLSILGLILLVEKFSESIDRVLFCFAESIYLTRLNLFQFQGKYFAIKFGLIIILFQLFYNFLLLKKVDRKYVLVIFNLLIILGLVAFVTSLHIMQS